MALNEKPGLRGAFRGVSDRTRTGDRLDHNQELYQLSYAHRVGFQSSVRWGRRGQAGVSA
jgi:hypothetical protein